MSGWQGGIVFLVVLQLALGLPYLEAVPRIYIDEVWDSSLGCNLADAGSLKHPFVEGFGGMDIHFVQSRVVLPLVCAAIFKVAGYSIAASRIGSVLFGVLAVISLYAVMRRWFGQKQAFFIGLATIIHPWFFEVSRRARPEIYYIGLGLVVLWLLTVFFDCGSRRAAFFTGVFAGLSGLVHPNGLILILAISCTLIAWRTDELLGRLICWAAMGFAITIMPYVIYVFWAIQDPGVSFAEQMQIGALRIWSVTREAQRWEGFLKWPKGAGLAVIMLLSWAIAWYRSKAADKAVAAIAGLYILILPFATVSEAVRYLAPIVPFFCALGVRLIVRIMTGEGVIRKGWYKSRLFVSAVVTVIYVSTSAAAIGLVFYRVGGACFAESINRIASVVGRDGRVCGDPILWVGHKQYHYGPCVMPGKPLTSSQAVAWARRHRFNYAVRTAWLLGAFKGIDEPPQSMPDFREGYMLDYFCAVYGTKVDEFRDPYYGPIEIYKLDWDNCNWDEYYRIRRGE